MKHKTNVAKLFTGIDDEKLMQSVLENLLTPAELDEISARLEIFKLLTQGVPQREIAEKLNVSLGTISRGSRELKYGKRGIKEIWR